jgi:hypothetical protein
VPHYCLPFESANDALWLLIYLPLSGLSPQSLQENLVESTTFKRVATSALLKAVLFAKSITSEAKERRNALYFVKSPNGFMHYPLPSDKRAHFYFQWPEYPVSIYTVKTYHQNPYAQVRL